jgi:hypothetical protein
LAFRFLSDAAFWSKASLTANGRARADTPFVQLLRLISPTSGASGLSRATSLEAGFNEQWGNQLLSPGSLYWIGNLLVQRIFANFVCSASLNRPKNGKLRGSNKEHLVLLWHRSNVVPSSLIHYLC